MNLDIVGKRLGDTEDLPEELKKELRTERMNNLDSQILELFDELEGFADINEILVGLYRKHKVIHKRIFLSNRVGKIVKLGLLKAMKGKRGIYEKVSNSQESKKNSIYIRKTLKEFALEVLQNSTSPLTTKEIANLVLASGYQTSMKRTLFHNAIYKTLTTYTPIENRLDPNSFDGYDYKYFRIPIKNIERENKLDGKWSYIGNEVCK